MAVVRSGQSREPALHRFRFRRARSTARYALRASPCATRSLPAPQVVSICEGMNSRQLVMKTKQRFVGRERFVFQPVSRVGKEPGNSLDDLSRIASNVSLRLTIRSGPLPDAVEHSVMQVSDIQFIQRVEGFHRPGPRLDTGAACSSSFGNQSRSTSWDCACDRLRALRKPTF